MDRSRILGIYVDARHVWSLYPCIFVLSFWFRSGTSLIFMHLKRPAVTLTSPVAACSQVYAFGILMFELITGSEPYPGKLVGPAKGISQSYTPPLDNGIHSLLSLIHVKPLKLQIGPFTHPPPLTRLHSPASS